MSSLLRSIHLVKRLTNTSNGHQLLGQWSTINQAKRGAKRYAPDKEFFKQFEGIVLLPDPDARWDFPEQIIDSDRMYHHHHHVYLMPTLMAILF